MSNILERVRRLSRPERLTAALVVTAAALSMAIAAKEMDPEPEARTSTRYVLEEAPNPESSGHERYWLNSGAYAAIDGDSASTYSGELPPDSKWAVAYARSNSMDTDRGAHPQNIFRLVTRTVHGDYAFSGYAVVKRAILSPSPNRNESNGIFLMMRARDSDNLYYAGLRVDGNAVVKKKAGGTYETLALVPVLYGPRYDRQENPNLIPLHVPIGLKAEIWDTADGNVAITLSTDIGRSGKWTQNIALVDETQASSTVLTGTAPAGIRSDFMEVTLDDIRIEDRKESWD